jgi:putative transposase
MPKSRYTEENMTAILREADRDGVPAVVTQHNVRDQTVHTWKKRFEKFQPDDDRRLKQLKQENARLKKLVAERDLEIEVTKETAAKNVERAGSPGAGDVCDAPNVSQRQAGTLIRVSRSALGYRSQLGVKDAQVLERTAALSGQYAQKTTLDQFF